MVVVVVVRLAHRVLSSVAAGGHREVVHTVPPLPATVTGPARQPGPLESPWLAAALLAAGLLVIAAWIVMAVRRKRRPRPGTGTPARPGARRAALTALAVLPLLAGACVAVNNYVGYMPTVAALGDLITGRAVSSAPPPPPRVPSRRGDRDRLAAASAREHPPATVGSSRLVELSIGAAELEMPARSAYVLLPPGYDAPANAAVRYPVVYLLHGYPSSPSDWIRAGEPQRMADLLVANHLMGPMILVFPATTPAWGHDTECLNAVSGPQLETYLARSVVGAVDRSFRSLPDRAARAIGGTSSGAYCALNLGLRNLDVFSVILGMMPYGDPGRHAAGTILGGDPALLRANSPSAFVATMRFRQPVAAFLAAAAHDRQVADTARALAGELAARGQYAALRVTPGYGHSWRETRAELPYALVFADRHLAAAG